MSLLLSEGIRRPAASRRHSTKDKPNSPHPNLVTFSHASGLLLTLLSPTIILRENNSFLVI